MSIVWTVYRQLDASLEAPLSSRPNRRGGEKSWTRNARCLVSIVGYGKRSSTEHDSDATLCRGSGDEISASYNTCFNASRFNILLRFDGELLD